MGTRVLFLPGAGCPSSMYEEWSLALSKLGFDSNVVTYPGHGQGEDPGGLSLCRYRTHVEDIILERGVRTEHPFILIGHSMGGDVALCAAESNPKVQGVILVNPAPPGGIFIGNTPLKRLVAKPVQYRSVLFPIFFNTSFEFHKEDVEELLLNGHEARDSSGKKHSFQRESGWAVWQLAMGSFKVDPQEVRCPVHVFCGSEDRLIDPKVQRLIANTYGTYHELPGSSHMPMFDANKESSFALIRETVEEIVYQKPQAPRKAA